MLINTIYSFYKILHLKLYDLGVDLFHNIWEININQVISPSGSRILHLKNKVSIWQEIFHYITIFSYIIIWKVLSLEVYLLNNLSQNILVIYCNNNATNETRSEFSQGYYFMCISASSVCLSMYHKCVNSVQKIMLLSLELELQIGESFHVGTGNKSLFFLESNKSSSLLGYLSTHSFGWRFSFIIIAALIYPSPALLYSISFPVSSLLLVLHTKSFHCWQHSFVHRAME